MSLLNWRNGAALLFFLSTTAAHCGEGAREIWNEPIARGWMDSHIAAVQRARHIRPSYQLSGTQIWASGIAPSGKHAFAHTDFDRTVGAKLQPFRDLNLRVGTSLTRSGGEDRLLYSVASWEAFWSGEQTEWGGLALGLSTVGSMDNVEAAYAQSLSGTFGIPLDLPHAEWHAELQVSPSINLDASSGSIGSSVLSEIRGQTVIGSRNGTYRSLLNVSVGYSLAPDARRVASGKLELRILPNL
jgi:hypothetical protein